MEVKQILQKGREIWKKQDLTLTQIIVRLGKVYGDICRWERNYQKDIQYHTDEELKKEFGNLIISTILWCDDLGYAPEACIREAIKIQIIFQEKNSNIGTDSEMSIAALLGKGRAIWPDKMRLGEIIVALGKVIGDICRWERNAPKDAIKHTDQKLMRGLGNVIFSSLRWCDDLGYDLRECIDLAFACQRKISSER